ncbi:polynucleotide 5'-hydroxyl-kinase NOL9 isoform X1 [Ricinus communis]|uniref:polynucleotide 5'-hydroxyl-kinase NOL9 isoform X1 n=1 Tax=Ricinus communis TaxID=3988 RepID=UPI0007721B7B|nr:polynucleotide 5'-hydroxyl-kinase NOL9 isoform X1 [Ricinus communis]|eukprot:XP_015578649.1 polynucleotide 5'-hydroxyl-kinase NOL9 [Ricinus communis]
MASNILETEEASSPSIHIPQEWSEAANTIAYDSPTSPLPVSLICGAKNCGKTTFSRYLLNTLLQRYRRVGYLDTDVGQPEFTTPGFVSLTVVDKLTPDLTIPCLKTPERCFFFGDVSSKRDPSTYLKYISTLCNYYRKEYCISNTSESTAKTELPLVVNTPGWVKGVGYDILVDMVKCIAPSHVVKINISSERKNLPAGAFWLDEDFCEEVNLIEINSARHDSFNRSVLVQKDARLLRDLRIMAYFRQCFSSSLNITTIKELANALASHPPYQVPISSIKIRHLHCQVPHTEIFYSLNASIVGLAVSSEQSETLPWCSGLGIVRGIDTSKGLLYMITPVPPSSLEKVDLLLQGFIQIPTCLLQVQGSMSPYMSTNVLATS